MAAESMLPALPLTGGTGVVQDARAELAYHRLFIRALGNRGWNVPPSEKTKLVNAMLRIVHHKYRPVKPNKRDPNPSHREKVQAARVLAAVAAQDNAIYLECLHELHVRERSGIEPYYPRHDDAATPTRAGGPEVIERTDPPPDATPETGPRTFPKELGIAALRQLMNERFPNLREELSGNG